MPSPLLLAILLAAPHWTALNNHKLYYETYGSGAPLLLLHGGGGSAQQFSNQIAYFEKTHFIVAPEQIGQGHTPDVRGPLTYSAMADDTAALLRQLNLKNVDVIGWSDGGILALMLAVRHPELVRRLVVSGANFAPEGIPRDELERMRKADEDGDWERAIDGKLNHMQLVSPTRDELSRELLGKIRSRVLVMAGDRDAIRLEHTVALYHTIPDARLCILPSTGHGTFIERPAWVNPIVQRFFEEP